jgi:hypothetical protein
METMTMRKESGEQQAETENGLVCEADIAAKPDVALRRLDTNEGQKGAEQKEGSALTAGPGEGEVLQRIFREAEEEMHPNNTPERNDDIARMKMLAAHLKRIRDLLR